MQVADDYSASQDLGLAADQGCYGCSHDIVVVASDIVEDVAASDFAVVVGGHLADVLC
ncbi:MAG: hypothetical protein IJD53_05835 [Alistipes sp.]|nr:hypothetical protein [Alistipes sp.]